MKLNWNNMKNKKINLGLSIFLIGIFLASSVFASSIYNNPSDNWQANQPSFNNYYSSSSGGEIVGIGDMWPILNRMENDQCEATSDFLIGILPGGCSPMVVRSDILEEQNVPVFCKLTALQVNPLIKVSSIKSISFKGDYPEGVAGISFHPARAAVKSYKTLLGNPLMNDIGYVVIILKQNRVEDDMEEWIAGNLTAIIRYDADKAFGVGNGDYYLPAMGDSDWQTHYKESSFWNGKGYLRVNGIGEGVANIDVMTSKDNVYRNFELKVGETSDLVYFPGYYCKAGLNVRLNKVVAPENMALLDIDGSSSWVREGDKVLNGKCSVRKLEAFSDGTGSVSLSCTGVKINLDLEKKGVEFRVEGEKKSAGLGDLIYDGELTGDSNKKVKTKWYLAYVGKWSEEIDSEEGEFALFFGRSNSMSSEDSNGISYAVEDLLANEEIDDKDKFLIALKSKKLTSSSSKSPNLFVIDKNQKRGVVEFLGFGEDALVDESNGADNYFELAGKALNDLLSDYPSEAKESGGTYGEEALIEQIRLAGQLKKFKTQSELMKTFLDKYPSSSATEWIRDEQLNLDKYDTSEASETIYLGNEYHSISVRNFKSVSEGEKRTDVRIGQIKKKDLREKERINLTKTEYIIIDKILPGQVEIDYKNSDKDAKIKSDSVVISEGSSKPLADRIISIDSVSVTEVAYLSLAPQISNTKTEANFTFRIGIEKRAIKLSPEKTKEMIKNLNESIERWREIVDTLGNVITGWKGACFATSAVLMIKNMASGFSGEAMARQRVMQKYKKICDTEYIGMSRSACYDQLNKDGKIDGDIDLYKNGINAVNKKMDGAIQSTGTSGDGLFGKTITNQTAYVNNLRGLLGTSPIVVKDAGGKEVTIDPKDLTTSAQIRSVLLHQQLGTTPEVQGLAQDDMNSALRGVVLTQQSEEKRKILEDKYTFGGEKLPVSVLVHGQSSFNDGGKRVDRGSLNNLVSVGDSGVKINEVIGDKENVGVQVVHAGQNDYLYIFDSENGGEKAVWQVREGEGKLNIIRKVDSLPKVAGAKVKLVSGGECSNSYKNPKVRFYESGNNKGLPAIVPFDLQNGWYAMVPNSAGTFLESSPKGYTASADVSYFKICNVGSNGVMENGRYPDDVCQSFSIHTAGDVSKFIPCPLMGSEDVKSLYQRGREAVRQASSQYGQKSFNILGQGGIGLGSPMSDSGDFECQDFMSIDDCKMMFNVCDPVICPPSRCNLGGKYPVADVVQSGIIGSIVLCLPNAAEGILVPICLTGIHAGLDSFVSILESERECLQHSLETGEHVGICDEITSIYLCEFFWRQLAPLLDMIIPKFVELAYGGFQSVQGGGEYMTVQTAWNNMQKSIDYFQGSYAQNAFKAFQFRNVEEAGTEICRAFVGTSFPTSANAIEALLAPESPSQYYAYFSENLHSEATVPATSHYKVYFHIYAGNDRGASYHVYLKNPPASSYYATNPTINVDRGYIPSGESADESIDFTAPSGYKELCVDVNGVPECGFKQVTTDFGLDYIQGKYVEEQIDKTDITTEKECISGSRSALSLISPNVQAGVEEAIQPEIALRGIVRICATQNPEAGVAAGGYVSCTIKEDGKDDCGGNPWKCIEGLCQDSAGTKKKRDSNWVDSGYCDDPNVRCWLDASSVKDDLKIVEAVDNKSIAALDESRGLIENARLGYEQVAESLASLRGRIKNLIYDNLKSGEDKNPPVLTILEDLNMIIGTDDLAGAGTNANRAEALSLKATVYRMFVERNSVEIAKEDAVVSSREGNKEKEGENEESVDDGGESVDDGVESVDDLTTPVDEGKLEVSGDNEIVWGFSVRWRGDEGVIIYNGKESVFYLKKNGGNIEVMQKKKFMDVDFLSSDLVVGALKPDNKIVMNLKIISSEEDKGVAKDLNGKIYDENSLMIE